MEKYKQDGGKRKKDNFILTSLLKSTNRKKGRDNFRVC